MKTRVMERSLIGVILAALCVVFVALNPMQAAASRGIDHDSFRAQLKQYINDRLCDRLSRLEGRIPLRAGVFKKCDQTPPPPEVSVEISANPETITEGDTSELSWSSENADSCVGDWNDSIGVDGSEEVSPEITTTYTIECEGEGDTTASDSVTVTVNPAEEETGTLVVRKVVIRDDGSETATTTFSFEVNDETPVFFDSDGEVSLVRPVGSYTIVEDAVEGFTTEYDNCENIELAADETETCTITNDDVEEGEEAPTVDLTASRSTVFEGSEGEATTTLSWTSTNADMCTASNAWSGDKGTDGSETVTPTETSTYAIECVGSGGTTTDSVNVDFVPEDEEEGTLVISEVLYNPSALQGAEAGNEWVEIFNGTAGTLDLSGYFIEDNSETFILPEGTSIASGSFLLLTGSTTTEGLWTVPDNASWLVLPGFTTQLANTDDSVELFNTASSSVDAVCWGANDAAFDCGPLGIADDGESLGRIDKFDDTGTAVGWQNQTPNPGE